MRIDNLAEARFTNAEAMKLLPTLPAKTLQNWLERDLLDKFDAKQPGLRNRKYSALGVITLAAMHELVKASVPPKNAKRMADGVADRALTLWAQSPDHAGDDGERKIIIRPRELHRGYIVRVGDDYRMEIVEVESLFLPIAYVVLQVDLLIIDMLNRMHRYVAGLPFNGTNDDPVPAKRKPKRKPAKKGRRK